MSKELNEKLCNAFFRDKIDYEEIAQLMKQGADPLGPLMDEDETAVGQLFCEAGCDWDIDVEEDKIISKDCLSDRLPEIMETLIENGFDCSRFKKSDEEGNHDLEMWSLTFSISKGACETVKIMIENGLPIPALEDFINHFYVDSEMVDGSEMTDDYMEYLVWAFKTIMLCASYPEIMNKSELICKCIEMNSTNVCNSYDLCQFRDYDNYEYKIDLSTIDNIPFGMRNATVEIIEKDSDKLVWKMHI